MKQLCGLVLVLLSLFAISVYAHEDEFEGVIRPTYDCTVYVYQTRPRCPYEEKTAVKFKLDPDFGSEIYGPYGEHDSFRYVSVKGRNCDLLLFRIDGGCSGISCGEEVAVGFIQDKQVLELEKPAQRMIITLSYEQS